MEQLKSVGRNYLTLIFNSRDMKVMLDSDLALLYGMSTKVLATSKADFMFILTHTEFDSLRSQIVTTNKPSRWVLSFQKNKRIRQSIENKRNNGKSI